MKLNIIPFLVILLSCNAVVNNNELLNIDLQPPVLQEINIKNEKSITIIFDEPVTMDNNDYKSDPILELSKSSSSENSLTLFFSKNQKPGKKYICRGDVNDEKGNTLSFIIRYYGWNPLIPDIIINEFNPEGSGNNPDSIELFVTSDGNTAGITIFTGTSQFYSGSYVLPALDVLKGDYIIIHMRPEGGDEEVSETFDKAISGGKLASDEAWDLWVDGDKPISGKNGVLSLYTNPFGEIIDAVPYSNRVSGDSEDYHGWTSATIHMIEELSFLDIWQNTDGFIRPEDAVWSNNTTGTRSICRDSSSSDSNQKDDWHTVPTGGKSFGEVNSDLVYEKK